MRNKKVVLLGVLAMLPLAACGGGGGNGSSSTGVVSASSVSPSSETSSEPVPVTPANGVFTYAAASYSEKAKIVGQLEGFGMDKFLTGIPMYDNGSNVLYSDRIEGMLDTYIPNYGFGVGRASITKPMAAEPTEAYKYYLHSFQTSDPASYNAWASTGSVEIDMMDMFTLGYYGTRPNAAGTNYEWYNSLATAKPIALNRDPDTKMATKWEVPLRFNEDGLVYNTLSTKATLAAFKGVKIQLEDYLTPFKNCLNLGWARSTDLASSASGFAGVQAYSDALSAGKTADWSNVGIQIADDKKGLTFTFNTPKTDFYAMYDLASGMYSPVPQAFMDALIALKTSSQDAKVMYGIFNDTGTGASGLTAVDSVLSTGVYVPEEIKSGQYLTFKKNDTCIEAADYHILGEKDWIWTGAATDATYAYNQYKTNANIDSVRVPTAKIKEEQSNPQRRVTKGDTVWKLNVNSCTQEQWNGFFGDSGTISQQGNDAYKCKPIMSNMNFLNGLYYSINRTELATNMGRNAAQGFFSDAYMIDPENSVSYRSSDEGKAVLATRSPETLGYSPAKATLLFQTAVQQEQAAGNYKGGTADNPVEIKLSCVYQDQGQIDDEGVTEKGYLENTFNAACKDLGVKLTIENSCGTVWSDVYYKYLMKGQCDLGFGSISGNTLDPLNFMDTLKSNNSSGFTLNWGADTSKVADTIVYDNHTWSYDALWAAGNSGTVCKDGENLDIFVNANGGEVDSVVDSLANTISGLSTSYTYYVDAKVSFVIDKVVWYNPNTKKEDISFDVSTVVTDDDNGTLTITFDLTNPSTETKSMGSQAIQGTTYDITYGYLSVYYSQTVAGVTTSGIESDIFFAFLVPQAATSSTTSAAGFVAPATGVSIARA